MARYKHLLIYRKAVDLTEQTESIEKKRAKNKYTNYPERG
jgi:hypothetical protein